MSGLFFVQTDIKESQNALFALFIIVLAYNLYFIGHWLWMFLQVMVRLHVRELKKNIFCRCLIERMNIDDYRLDLKRERKKRRHQERVKRHALNSSVLKNEVPKH